MSRRNRDLKFCQLHELFQSIHRNAISGLIKPLALTMLEWLKPVINAKAEEVYNEIVPLQQRLLGMDHSLGVTNPSSSFDRKVVLFCHRPPCCWYSDPVMTAPEPMSFPKFSIEVPHHQTWGKQHIMRALGKWVDYGMHIELAPGDVGLGEKLPFSPEVWEAFDFTMEQLGHVHKELSEWYWQFSVGEHAPQREPNTITKGEQYHRVAAAMYFSPVINQWAHYLHEQTTIELAPQSMVLRKNTSFNYRRAMPVELSSALQTGLSLRQSMDTKEGDQDG